MNKKCRKWITRDKLRRCENNVVYQDINIDNPIETEKLVAEDDENDVYIFEHLHNENSGVNVRRYPRRKVKRTRSLWQSIVNIIGRQTY